MFSLDQAWNFRKPLPPDELVKVDINKSIIGCIENSIKVLITASDILKEHHALGSELYILSRFLARRKAQIRRHKVRQVLSQVETCVRRFQETDLAGLVKVIHQHFQEAKTKQQTGSVVRLPSYGTLQYALVRLIGVAALLAQTVNYCVHATFILQIDVKLAHLLPQALLCLGMVSRIWVCSRCLYMDCVSWYTSLLPVLQILPHGQPWLSEDEKLPTDLNAWLGDRVCLDNMAIDPPSSCENGTSRVDLSECDGDDKLDIKVESDREIQAETSILLDEEDIGAPVKRPRKDFDTACDQSAVKTVRKKKKKKKKVSIADMSEGVTSPVPKIKSEDNCQFVDCLKSIPNSDTACREPLSTCDVKKEKCDKASFKSSVHSDSANVMESELDEAECNLTAAQSQLEVIKREKCVPEQGNNDHLLFSIQNIKTEKDISDDIKTSCHFFHTQNIEMEKEDSGEDTVFNKSVSALKKKSKKDKIIKPVDSGQSPLKSAVKLELDISGGSSLKTEQEKEGQGHHSQCPKVEVAASRESMITENPISKQLHKTDQLKSLKQEISRTETFQKLVDIFLSFRPENTNEDKVWDRYPKIGFLQKKEEFKLKLQLIANCRSKGEKYKTKQGKFLAKTKKHCISYLEGVSSINSKGVTNMMDVSTLKTFVKELSSCKLTWLGRTMLISKQEAHILQLKLESLLRKMDKVKVTNKERLTALQDEAAQCVTRYVVRSAGSEREVKRLEANSDEEDSADHGVFDRSTRQVWKRQLVADKSKTSKKKIKEERE